MSKICRSWNYVSNHASDDDRRIIINWKDPLKVQIVKQGRQALTCTITLPQHLRSWYQKLDDWRWFQPNSPLFRALSLSSVAVHDGLMYQFHDCLLQCGVFDLRFNGLYHSWTNNRLSNPIWKKLDRFLVNPNSISSYPHAFASYLPQSFSDHCPCLLDLSYCLPTAGTKPYKFQNYLTKHPDFQRLLTDVWVHTGSICSTLAQLCSKLKVIKKDLKTINRENFSKIQERVSETYGLLQIVQVQALQTPSPQLFQDERDLHTKWIFLRQIEESFFPTGVSDQLA